MRKYFYKGESLSILLQTPIPEVGERVKITDYEVTAIIQGVTPSIETITDYEIRLFLSSAQTKQLNEGRADIVITLTQGEKAVIGKNISLFVSDPLTSRPIDGMSDTEDMILAMNTGDMAFNLSLAHVVMSPYQFWIEKGNIGSQQDFENFLRQPALDAANQIMEEYNIYRAEILAFIESTQQPQIIDGGTFN